MKKWQRFTYNTNQRACTQTLNDCFYLCCWVWCWGVAGRPLPAGFAAGHAAWSSAALSSSSFVAAHHCPVSLSAVPERLSGRPWLQQDGCWETGGEPPAWTGSWQSWVPLEEKTNKKSQCPCSYTIFTLIYILIKTGSSVQQSVWY